MLIKGNQQAVLRIRLVAVIVPVAASVVHRIIVAVIHTIMQEAQAVQLDSKTTLILDHNTENPHLFFIFMLSVRL